jgi:hypothetical protein
MNIFLPVVIFFLAIYLRDRFVSIKSPMDLNMIFYFLLALSAVETLTIFILKTRTWKPYIKRKLQENPRLSIEKGPFGFGTIIYVLCFSPTIYGLVYYILGGTWEHFALFVAITFLLFQLFKPKMEELEKLNKEFNTSD